MKGKTLNQITNTPKAGLKELPSLPTNEDFTVEIISKDSGKVYTVSTDALGSGGGGGIESIVEGTNITVDDTDPQNPIISATGGGSPAGSDTQIQYNNAGAFGADSGFTRTSTGVTNISSTFGDETLQYQISDNLFGSGKHGILTQFTVPLGSLMDYAFSDGGDISSAKILSYPSLSTKTESEFSYNKYLAKVTTGTDQGNLYITSQESSLTKITDLDGINSYKTGFRTSGGSATIGDIAGGNNTKITIDDVTQLVTISNVPTYADDAAAAIGGLTSGMLYKTTTGGITALNIVP